MAEWRPIPPKRAHFDPMTEWRDGCDLLRTGLPEHVTARASASVGDRTLVARCAPSAEPSGLELVASLVAGGVRAGLFGPGGDARASVDGATLRLELPGTEPAVARALTRLLAAAAPQGFELTEEGPRELLDVTRLPRLSEPAVPFSITRSAHFGQRKVDSVVVRVAPEDEEAALGALTPLFAAWSACALGFEGFYRPSAVFFAQPPTLVLPGELSFELDPAQVGPEAPLALMHGLLALGPTAPPVLELGLGGLDE